MTLMIWENDMTSEASPNGARPTDEIVDVLIIGSGASGAAVAWSLAETRMKILCLEQGDWVSPSSRIGPKGRIGGVLNQRLSLKGLHYRGRAGLFNALY